ncbi:MAG: NACHT domain-containing protein [Aureispira sp.]
MNDFLPPIAWLMLILGLCSCFIIATKKQHPRELFAFFALFAWSGWVLLMAILWQQQDFGDMDMDMGIPIGNRTDWEIFWLLVLVLVAILSLWGANYFHQHWSSAIISENDFFRQARNEDSSIFKSAQEQLQAFFRLQWTPKLYQESSNSTVATIIYPIDKTIVPWHIQALQLLHLLDPQYKVHPKEDWYNDHDCYLGYYGKEKDGTAILCYTTQPEEDSIQQLIQFVNERKKGYDTLLILIEQGTESAREERRGSLLVKYRYKAEMLAQLVDFTSYFKHLKERFEATEIHPGSNKALVDVYTPLSATSNTATTAIKIPHTEQYILDWVAQENTTKQLAVLGEYGQGKSVLSLKVSLTLSQQVNARIPILIELSGKSPRNMDLEELLFVWAQKYHISTAALLQLHQEGRLLLIFEGFDEMDLAGDKSMRLAHFRQLWQFAKAPNAKLLFTGRPNFFMDETEQAIALGSRKNNLPYCEILSLQFFTIEQLLVSLRHVDTDIRQSLIAVLEKQVSQVNKNFYQMIARPSTLSLITVIWKKADFIQRKEQLNSALVLQEYIQFAYDRQQKKQSLFPLSSLERQYFMLGIAIGMMQQNGYTNQISNYQLQALVYQLLEHFPAALSRQQHRSELPRPALKERLLEDEQHLQEHKEALLTDIRTCGILVKDPTKSNHFRFAHKSFLEYLVSSYYVATLLEKETLVKKMSYGILRAVDNNTLLRTNQEIIKFIGELLAKEHIPNNNYAAAEHLRKILDVHPIKLYFAFMRKKIYLQPVPFLVVFGLAFLLSTIITFITMSLMFFVNIRVSTNFLLFLFYFSLLFFCLIISRKVNHRNEGVLLRIQIWYKACQACSIERSALESVMSNTTLKYIERYLRKIGTLPLFLLSMLLNTL